MPEPWRLWDKLPPRRLIGLSCSPGTDQSLPDNKGEKPAAVGKWRAGFLFRSPDDPLNKT